jgi:hypothetical protein
LPVALLATAVIIAAVAVLATETGLEVQVVPAESAQAVVRVPVEAGARVELRYRHSVERTPVVEVFRAGPAGLDFVEMRFSSQGAGLPTEGYVRENGVFVLRRPRHVGALPLAVSALAGHTLWVNDRTIDLVAAAGDGSRVSVRVSSVRVSRIRR